MGNKKTEKFICYETYQVKTFHQWRLFYEESDIIDKYEYPDFYTWWLDMRQSGVIELLTDEVAYQGEVNAEKFIVLKHGEDDFSIAYDNSNCSLRGSKADVEANYMEHFGNAIPFL